MLELKNITKAYGKGSSLVVALDDINLEIADGEFLAIVGKSGSGKSTLLNLIGALDKPSDGEILYNGENITNYRDNALAKYRNKNIGFVFQAYYLEPTFTVLENVVMPLSIADVKKKEREERGREVIARLGLTEKTDVKTKELSGGQKQRVSMARAIINNPQIILADEPTGNLDEETGKIVIDLLLSLKAEGRTIVLVTHNKEDAKYCDRIVQIDKGRIVDVTKSDAEVVQA